VETKVAGGSAGPFAVAHPPSATPATAMASTHFEAAGTRIIDPFSFPDRVTTEVFPSAIRGER
jgi:hypothetical protein